MNPGSTENAVDDYQLLLRRSIDDDTHVLRTDARRVGDFVILLEQWTADGVMGSSAVLLTRDAGKMNDEELKGFLAGEAGLDLGETVTITRGETHTFVNFAFEMD